MPEETEQPQEPAERKRYQRRDDNKIMVEVAPHQFVNEVSAVKLNLMQRNLGHS
jgi:hypothetical protein